MIKTLSTSLALAGISTSFVFISQISPARAISLIGNLPQNNDVIQNFIGSPLNVKALAFTLPTGNNYTLDNVILRLWDYDAVDTPLVQIRDDGGVNPGSNVLASFNNPSAQGTGIFDYEFTPTSPFTFVADTKYWLWVSTTSGTFGFPASLPGITPTGIATLAGNRFSFNGGASFNDSGFLNSFQINATEVATPIPEPTTIPGIILGYAFLRFRKASSKSKIAEVKS